MNPAGGAPLWLITASRREHVAVAMAFEADVPIPSAGGLQLFATPAGPLAVLHTGLGVRMTVDRLRMLDRHASSGWISIGFCGGLVPEMRCGDVVLYRECATLDDGGDEVGRFRATPELFDRLQSRFLAQGLQVRPVCGVTSHHIVESGAAKAQLGRSLNAAVVDMETGAIFETAIRRGLPAAAVRVVLDEVNQNLPEFEPLRGANGQFIPGARQSLLLKHPRLALQLRRGERIALDAITRAASVLGTPCPPPPR